jgi:hypothetical protein
VAQELLKKVMLNIQEALTMIKAKFSIVSLQTLDIQSSYRVTSGYTEHVDSAQNILGNKLIIYLLTYSLELSTT